MKILYPEQVFLIRGQNEFRESEGFLHEIETLYEDTTLYLPFIQMFSILPVSCLINKTILCVNGGFGPNIVDLDCISKLKRPIVTFNYQVLIELFWSDPTEALPMYLPSLRGLGILYGEQALNDFLKEIKKRAIVRGHQCVDEGCKLLFNNQLVTVYSASSTKTNKSGYLNIQSSEPDVAFDARALYTLEPLMKTDVNFIVSENDTTFAIPQIPMFMQNASIF